MPCTTTETFSEKYCEGGCSAKNKHTVHAEREIKQTVKSQSDQLSINIRHTASSLKLKMASTTSKIRRACVILTRRTVRFARSTMISSTIRLDTRGGDLVTRCTVTDCISPQEASCSLGRCGPLRTRRCKSQICFMYVVHV